MACLDWIFIRPEVSCVHDVTDKENLASRSVMGKIGMRYEKDVDLYDSIEKGGGMLLFYSIDLEAYLSGLLVI